eukprot:1073214-Prorocentrum_minimum.AAC.1
MFPPHLMPPAASTTGRFHRGVPAGGSAYWGGGVPQYDGNSEAAAAAAAAAGLFPYRGVYQPNGGMPGGLPGGLPQGAERGAYGGIAALGNGGQDPSAPRMMPVVGVGGGMAGVADYGHGPLVAPVPKWTAMGPLGGAMGAMGAAGGAAPLNVRGGGWLSPSSPPVEPPRRQSMDGLSNTNGAIRDRYAERPQSMDASDNTGRARSWSADPAAAFRQPPAPPAGGGRALLGGPDDAQAGWQGGLRAAGLGAVGLGAAGLGAAESLGGDPWEGISRRSPEGGASAAGRRDAGLDLLPESLLPAELVVAGNPGNNARGTPATHFASSL